MQTIHLKARDSPCCFGSLCSSEGQCCQVSQSRCSIITHPGVDEWGDPEVPLITSLWNFNCGQLIHSIRSFNRHYSGASLYQSLGQPELIPPHTAKVWEAQTSPSKHILLPPGKCKAGSSPHSLQSEDPQCVYLLQRAKEMGQYTSPLDSSLSFIFSLVPIRNLSQ